MKSYKNIEELNKEWGKFGFRINEKGELLGAHKGKEYKVGQIRKRVVSSEELEKLLEKEKADNQEQESKNK